LPRSDTSWVYGVHGVLSVLFPLDSFAVYGEVPLLSSPQPVMKDGWPPQKVSDFDTMDFIR